MRGKDRYQAARTNLLLMMVFSLVNVAMGLLDSDTYFLFSNTLAYLAAVFGRSFYETVSDPMFLVLGAAAAVLVLIPYLLCWIFSKKKTGWMIAALVLFSLDTVFLVLFYLPYFELPLLLDVGFHIWVLVCLILGLRSGRQADPRPENAAGRRTKHTEEKRFYDASQPAGSRQDSVTRSTPAEGRSRVLVTAEYGGHVIEARRSHGLTELVVDGRACARQEGVVESAYTISARVAGHTIATSLTALGRQTIEVDGEVIAKKQRLL